MLKWIPLVAVLLFGTASIQGLEVKTAYTRHYQAAEIRTVSEYFGARLLGQRFRTIVASQSDNPTGQYFIIKLADAKGSGAVTARMALYRTDRKDPDEWSWSLKDIELDNWLYLGLTGSDWPDEATQPLAWHLELLDASGSVIADWKSFLWEMED